jgi:hypothetical protein
MGAMVVALQQGGGARMAGIKANTPEETEAALEGLGADCIRIYTDGGGCNIYAPRSRNKERLNGALDKS